MTSTTVINRAEEEEKKSGVEDPSPLDFVIPPSSLYPNVVKMESVRQDLQSMFSTSFTPSPPPYPLSPLSPLPPPHTTSVSSPSALHNSPSSSSTSSPLCSSAVKKESGLDFNFDDPLSSSTKIVVTFNRHSNSMVKFTEPVVKKKSPPKSNISCTPALPKVQLKRLDFNELKPSPLSPNRFCVKDSAFDISNEHQRHHLRPVLPFNPYSSEKFVHGRRTKKQSSSKKRQNAKNVKNEKWTRKLKPNC